MTQVLSWNIQNGIGVDGVLSLQRIATEIKQMASPDVICLQEISRGLQLERNAEAPDQIAELEDLFPDYEVIFGVAVDAATKNGTGPRWQFGNAILSKRPVVSVQHHILPKPAVSEVRHITRQTSEIVVNTDSGALRILNLHLEFHSLLQRVAQINKIRELQFEAMAENQRPPEPDPSGPYQTVSRPLDSICCGDFNMLVDSEEYSLMISPLEDEACSFHDAWEIVHTNKTHDPTCGIFDHKSWPQGPHCRDFFFVTGNYAKRVTDFVVNTKTNASDHQPMMITLKD